MKINNLQSAALVVLALVLSQVGANAQIVNINATFYGFQYPGGGSDPAPMPGQVVNPISNAPGGGLLQLTLGPGTYSITNGSGLPGADPNFTGWRFNSGNNWVWNFLLINDANHQVIFYDDRGGVQGSQSAIASDPTVQNYFGTFTLASTTTVDFAIRDFFLPDNAGGISLNIRPVSEPMTSSLILGVALFGGLRYIRRQRRSR